MLFAGSENTDKSEGKLNTKVTEDFLSFLTVIYTPSYDQWFNNYESCKLTGLLKLCYVKNG
jgi:hypothetical protein